MHGKEKVEDWGDTWAMGQLYQKELRRFHKAAALLPTYSHPAGKGFFASNEQALDAVRAIAASRDRYVLAAAIVYERRVWTLPAPCRHHDLIEAIYNSNGKGVNGTELQGFVDSNGAFLTREQAFVLAKAAGQLIDSRSPGPVLFSEDVW